MAFPHETIIKRLALGFDKIHDQLKSYPYCEKNQQISKLTYCSECFSPFCHRNDLCCLCLKNGEVHFIDYPHNGENDDESSFTVPLTYEEEPRGIPCEKDLRPNSFSKFPFVIRESSDFSSKLYGGLLCERETGHPQRAWE